ncbi:hypothetical protein SNUCP2_25170 [Clostridium perfringens A]
MKGSKRVYNLLKSSFRSLNLYIEINDTLKQGVSVFYKNFIRSLVVEHHPLSIFQL